MMRVRRIYYYYLFINFFLNDKQTLPGNHWKKLLRISLKRTVTNYINGFNKSNQSFSKNGSFFLFDLFVDYVFYFHEYYQVGRHLDLPDFFSILDWILTQLMFYAAWQLYCSQLLLHKHPGLFPAKACKTCTERKHLFTWHVKFF